ncbi:hypothetical protein QJS66_11090 [Kocuria rhizophila]|nr:hypothetical protein QJS66_11090 [Kocuria rhizophila]
MTAEHPRPGLLRAVPGRFGPFRLLHRSWALSTSLRELDEARRGVRGQAARLRRAAEAARRTRAEPLLGFRMHEPGRRLGPGSRIPAAQYDAARDAVHAAHRAGTRSTTRTSTWWGLRDAFGGSSAIRRAAPGRAGPDEVRHPAPGTLPAGAPAHYRWTGPPAAPR